jgi:DNA-binding beta-propeller fold protein YncE
MLSRRTTRALAVAGAFALGAAAAAPSRVGAQAASAPNATLWVTLGDSDELVEVDAYSFREVRRITTDPRPHGLAASSDGLKIYVGSDRTGNFQVIDARSGRIEAQIPLGKDPNQMTLTRDGRYAYVPMRGEDSVAIVELNPLRLLRKVPMNKGPHDAYTTGDGSRIYVGAQYGNAVGVFDPATFELLHQIPTSDGVRPLALSKDSRTVYVALSNLLGFVVVDAAKRAVTRRVELGTLPDGVPKPYLDTYTHAIQLVKDDTELWITDCINDLVRIVRTSDLTEIGQIRVGKFPHWFTMRPDGEVLFVSLWDSHAVAAIDVQSRKVLANVQFARGSGPKRILIAPKAP